MGRGKHTGVRDIFQGCGSGSSSLCVRDVDDDPLHGPGPGGFPEQASEWKLGVPPLGGGDMGGGFGGGGGVCPEEAEYCFAVYFDATDSGSLLGSVA